MKNVVLETLHPSLRRSMQEETERTTGREPPTHPGKGVHGWERVARLLPPTERQQLFHQGTTKMASHISTCARVLGVGAENRDLALLLTE